MLNTAKLSILQENQVGWAVVTFEARNTRSLSRNKISSTKETSMPFRSLTSCSVKYFCGLVLKEQNPTGFSLLLPLLNSFFYLLAFLYPLCWASSPRWWMTCLIQALASAYSLHATNTTWRDAWKTDMYCLVNGMFCALDLLTHYFLHGCIIMTLLFNIR